MNTELLRNLADKTGALLLMEEPLKKHLSLKIGGETPFFISPGSWAAMEEIYSALISEKIEFKLLGAGTNIMASDKALPFGIIYAGKLGGRIDINEDGRVVADADCPLVMVVLRTVRAGLSGLEGMGGIPGSLGGAIATNAGAYGCEMSAVVERIEIIEPGKGRVSHPVSDFEFGYRSSNVVSSGLIARCELKLKPAPADLLSSRHSEAAEKRKATQPWGIATAGSVFKNPEGDYAGRILEELGFKGKKRGNAGFSDIHANFLVNYGGATFMHAFGLCEEARTAAAEEGHTLRYELEIWQ